MRLICFVGMLASGALCFYGGHMHGVAKSESNMSSDYVSTLDANKDLKKEVASLKIQVDMLINCRSDYGNSRVPR